MKNHEDRTMDSNLGITDEELCWLAIKHEDSAEVILFAAGEGMKYQNK